MPTTTANKPAVSLENILFKSAHLGAGMQVKLMPDNLAALATLRPGDTFQLDYCVQIVGMGDMKATLDVSLNDPNGLFAGHSIVAVLGNLISQIVEHKLTGAAPAAAPKVPGVFDDLPPDSHF